MTKKQIPKRRFSEFINDGAWEQRELGELADFNPKADLPDTFKYVDLESVVGTEMIAHRVENKATAPSRAQRLARQGDLFYQTVRPYQKNNYLLDQPCKDYVFSTGYAQMRPHNDGYFLLCLVQTEPFVKAVLDRCTGTSYPAINSNDLADIRASIPPDVEEENALGQFFRKLDHLITLQQRKLEKIKNLKSAYLAKMFPKEGEKYPELRFAGFTEAWEQRSLGEIAQITMGQSPNSKNYTDNPNDHILVQGNADMKNGQVLPRVWTTQVTKQAEKNDLILSVRAPVGDVGKTDYDVVLGRGVAGIKGNEFIFQLLTRMKENGYWRNLSTGSTFESINSNNIKEAYVLIPNNEEQIKIGLFLKYLDNLITLHQRKLEKLNGIKQAYLNEMFV